MRTFDFFAKSRRAHSGGVVKNNGFDAAKHLHLAGYVSLFKVLLFQEKQ